MTPPFPPENHYGHTKKLHFLIDEIGRHRDRVGRPLTMLDFGCGNGGAVSQYLTGEGIRYFGVDIHQASLDYARANFSKPGVSFLDHIPEDVEFDVVVYADVLEHLDDPAAMMRLHRTQLAADGIVVGAVPNGFGPFEIEQYVDRRLFLSRLLAKASRSVRKTRGKPETTGAASPPYNSESGHVVFFTRRKLKRVFAEAGFEIIRFGHGAFIGASVSGILLGRSPRLRRWNVKIADRLPYWAVSTWYFSLRPGGG